MTGTVNFARCPEHGLHGQRDECFDCNRPVEQVPFVPLGPLVELIQGVKANAEAQQTALWAHTLEGSYRHGLVDGAFETCSALLQLLAADVIVVPTDSGGITEGADDPGERRG